MKYKDQGNVHFKAGRFTEALECYTFATEIDPKNPIFFQNRAMAYFKLGKYEKALRDSNKALKLNPKSFKAYFRKAESLFNLKSYDECLKVYEEAANLFPDQQVFVTGKAKAKSALLEGKSQAEILKLDGNEAFKKGKMDDAIKLFTSAINVADTSTDEGKLIAANIYANRAAVNRQLYLSDKVVEDCTKAIELVPTHVKAYIRRGQAYESLEKYEKALEDFQIASKYGGGLVASKGASRCRRAVRATGKDTKRI